MSPESFTEKCDNFKADVWSLGIVFYEIIAGQVPWYETTKERRREEIKNGYVDIESLNIKRPFKLILVKMLSVPPVFRYTMKEIQENIAANISPITTKTIAKTSSGVFSNPVATSGARPTTAFRPKAGTRRGKNSPTPKISSYQSGSIDFHDPSQKK